MASPFWETTTKWVCTIGGRYRPTICGVHSRASWGCDVPITQGLRQSVPIRSPCRYAFENVADFISVNELADARNYFFCKELLIVWTMLNRWTWRDRGIRMNCVSPGPVDTPILPDFIESLGKRAEEDMRVMDRPGTPEDIAPLVAFLCSDTSAWIRGANLPCDGGLYSHIAEHNFGLS